MADKKETQRIGAVMVVGAGIAGMQAALDLATAGFYVHLVDRSPTIGGMMAQLDKTFPTNDCAMWIISPKLVEVGRHQNINIITNSEVETLEGEPGNFEATLRNSPRYIDPGKCTGCGQCSLVCPVNGVDEFDCGLSLRAATSIKYAQAVPLAYTIDPDLCIGCGLCEKVCMAEAIRYDDEPKKTNLKIGAVILAVGNEVFDPSSMDTYSYTESPNVVTSIEFERILSAAGPYMGHLMRPYDREEPKKIAFLQCVGSRDINQCDHPYCSSVCCMYAIKEAVIAMEHAHGKVGAAIFYMDMRTHGKDFEDYYDRAKEEHAVRFIRSRVHSVVPVEDGDLSITYTDETGEQKIEVFNLVVLSVGFQVGKDAIELGKRLGIQLNRYNFAKTGSFMPVSTTREGVYVCGAFQGPKDIPQSVIEASSAAAAAGAALSPARNTLTKTKVIPKEVNVMGEKPRVGVFVCRCGINIAGVVDVPAVCEYAKSLPYVVFVTENLYSCSQDTQESMSQVIKDNNLNRVVVASCTPKTHEPLFQETLVDAGLNKYLFEMTNIRNQDSWVHQNNPEQATEKAKDLVRMAVAKVVLMEPLKEAELDVNQEALVVGGGISGMVAAKTLSEQGYPVSLVERGSSLGGQALHLFSTWKGEDVQNNLSNLIKSVETDDNIEVHLNTELINVEGFVGNFKSTIKSGTMEGTVEHGVAVLATGAYEYKPREYLYGEDPRVLTHLELDQKFINNDPDLKDINAAVFIQCVGSREPERPYCSRVCCTHSIESALHLKQINPDMDIYILYRDIRTYGERELLYKKARESGIFFIRFSLDQKPEVAAGREGLEITVVDPILQRQILLKADLVALASAIVPYKDEKLAQYFKVPMNKDGFFVEAHVKLAPSEFATDGVFLCGMAHYPKPIDEAVAQAQAAVSRATTLLARKTISVGGTVAYANPMACSSCGVCVDICPYSAPSFIEKGPFTGKAEINPILCKGCGLCVASCRSGALNLKGFEAAQMMAMINEI